MATGRSDTPTRTPHLTPDRVRNQQTTTSNIILDHDHLMDRTASPSPLFSRASLKGFDEWLKGQEDTAPLVEFLSSLPWGLVGVLLPTFQVLDIVKVP